MAADEIEQAIEDEAAVTAAQVADAIVSETMETVSETIAAVHETVKDLEEEHTWRAKMEQEQQAAKAAIESLTAQNQELISQAISAQMAAMQAEVEGRINSLAERLAPPVVVTAEATPEATPGSSPPTNTPLPEPVEAGPVEAAAAAIEQELPSGPQKLRPARFL